VHYIKEDLEGTYNMALLCCRFPKKERKKERKWVFFGADMPIAFES